MNRGNHRYSVWFVIVLFAQSVTAKENSLIYTNYPLVLHKANSPAEQTAIGSPDVVKFHGQYLMVYAQGGRKTGSSHSDRINRGRIGMAYSADGISWTRQGSILSPSAGKQWDNWFVDTPSLLIKEGKAYLYYFGDGDNTPSGGAIGLAVSDDLVHWKRVGQSPVLSAGTARLWDGNWVESPSVIYNRQTHTFHMWYTGVDKSWIVRTGHATSADGIHWTKDLRNPVLGEPNAHFTDHYVWDGSGAGVASVSYHNGVYCAFYASQSVRDTLKGSVNPQIGLAISKDGSHFTLSALNPVVNKAETGGQPNGPYNPAGLYAKGQWHIWYETGNGIGLITIHAKKSDHRTLCGSPSAIGNAP